MKSCSKLYEHVESGRWWRCELSMKTLKTLCFAVLLTMVALGLMKRHKFGTSEFFPYEFYLVCLSNSTKILIEIKESLRRKCSSQNFDLNWNLDIGCSMSNYLVHTISFPLDNCT